MQKLFGFGKLCGTLSIAVLTSFVVVDARAAAQCGVNLFNPQLLDDAGFTRTNGDNGEYAASGTWEYLDNYVSNYSFNFFPDKAYTVSYSIECPEELVGNTYLTFKLSDETYVTTNTNVCSSGSGMRTVKIDMPANKTAVGMAVRNINTGAGVSNRGFKISNVMVALTDTQDGFVAYEPCIKLTTPHATEIRMAAVESRLDGVMETIDGLITQMQTNASDVGDLQTNKQTRPAAACPVGKKCLLVQDKNQNNKWYEIIDCGETLPSFGTYNGGNVYSGLYGPGEPWGYSVTGRTHDKLMCSSTAIACGDDEWVTPYSDALVYGTARRVAIAERTHGAVVKLPTNVQSGNVCVCKATRYRMYTGDLRDQSSAAEIGDIQSIDTDKWFVAGIAADDVGCFSSCGSDAHSNGVSKLNYLEGISNTCMAAVDTAQMCVYDEFLNGLYAGLTATSGSGQMTLLGDSQGTSGVRVYGSCNSSGDFYNDNDICGTNAANPGAWVAGPVSATGNAVYNGAIVYGKSRCVDATEALNALSDFDVVYLDNAPSASSTGTVCLHNITGYKPGNGSKTAVAADAQKVWIVKKYNSAAECNANDVASGCYGESWTENFLRTGHYDFYGRVADVCAAN